MSTPGDAIEFHGLDLPSVPTKRTIDSPSFSRPAFSRKAAKFDLNCATTATICVSFFSETCPDYAKHLRSVSRESG